MKVNKGTLSKVTTKKSLQVTRHAKCGASVALHSWCAYPLLRSLRSLDINISPLPSYGMYEDPARAAYYHPRSQELAGAYDVPIQMRRTMKGTCNLLDGWKFCSRM